MLSLLGFSCILPCALPQIYSWLSIIFSPKQSRPVNVIWTILFLQTALTKCKTSVKISHHDTQGLLHFLDFFWKLTTHIHTDILKIAWNTVYSSYRNRTCKPYQKCAVSTQLLQYPSEELYYIPFMTNQLTSVCLKGNMVMMRIWLDRWQKMICHFYFSGFFWVSRKKKLAWLCVFLLYRTSD